MDFGGLLGNETLKARLKASFSAGHVLHSYLLTGPTGSGRHTLARWMAAAMTCGGKKPPCLGCESCRKVFAGVHPDVFVVDSDKAQVGVDVIRQACADAWVRPTEGLRRVFIIPRAGDMNPQSQNALLKTIEEPPDSCGFLLLCENDGALLPTVRSRCASLALSPLADEVIVSELAKRRPDSTPVTRQQALERCGGYLGQALELLDKPQSAQALALAAAFARRDPLAVLEAAIPLENLKRDQLLEILQELSGILTDALLASAAGVKGRAQAQAIAAARTGRDISDAIAGVGTLRRWCQANVGPGHLAGALSLLLYQPGKYPPGVD